MGGFAAGLGVVGSVFLMILMVLALLMPFFVYGTNHRTKETAFALKQSNSLLKGIRDELAHMRKQSERTTIPTDNPNNPSKDIKPKTTQNNQSKSNRLFPADTFKSEEEQLDTDSGQKYSACPKCKTNNTLDATVCRCGQALSPPK